ncbi:Arb2 domain-containing protein [Nemania sp. FL0916]|nr:Arb2 domain-containing protein [Nemania sp. FL0916]
MFKRKWSALPKDAQFPSDLKGLGYFINKDDEVRSIQNEDNYFKYFISRNSRVNDRQRFAMNQAVQDEIHKRLISLGLNKIYLPIGTTAPLKPHVPIFMSDAISSKSRVVVIFGEVHQDLGVLAHRVLGGKGGIDKGSLVSVVKALLQTQCSPADPSAPGIILANVGELLWWPEGNRTLNRYSYAAAPMRSAAHLGNYVDPKVNIIPGHEDPAAHVKYIFENVVPTFVKATAGLDIIGLGDGADVVESYLNCDAVWERMGSRINCFASVGGQFPSWDVKCDALRDFLIDRARAYVLSNEAPGLVISGPAGNPNTTTFTSLGCPVFSAGEPVHVETLFIASYQTVLDWLQEVADSTARNKPYKNPLFTIVYSDNPGESDDSTGWGEDGSRPTDSVDGDGGLGAGLGGLSIVTSDGVIRSDITNEAEPAKERVGELEAIDKEK